MIIDGEAARIATDIDQQGFGTLSNYIPEVELEPIRAIARAAVRASGGESVFFTGPDAFAGTVLSELPQSAAFKDLCSRLYELGSGLTASEVNFHQIFRCLQGATGQKRHSYSFHYDGFILTALLPIVIPENGPRGDLVIIPHTRRIRRWYLCSLLENHLVKTTFAQLILRIAYRLRLISTVTIRLQPGTIYFFWGNQSIHANEPCERNNLRATAVFQYGNPYQRSKMYTMTTKVRRRIGQAAGVARRMVDMLRS